jgi:hypothetical protein
MWILKGLILGSILSVVFCAVYLRSLTGPIRQNSAVSLSMLSYFTIHKSLFWIALALTFVSCFTWARLISR